MTPVNTVKSNMFGGKKWIVVFYIVFVFFSGLSLVFVPNVLSYPYAAEVSIVLILMPVLYSLHKNLGFKKTLLFVLILASLTLAIEYIALVTSYPYGEFFYNESLSGKINGILPWTTGLSYLPFLFGAVGVSGLLVKNPFRRVILSAVILVVFDLVLDPGAVSVGMWGYTTPGVYYGVPFSNFVGWAVSGVFMSAVAVWMLRKFPTNKLVSLSYSFCISIFLWVWIDLLKQLWVPFVIGVFIIMYLLMIYSKYEKINPTV